MGGGWVSCVWKRGGEEGWGCALTAPFLRGERVLVYFLHGGGEVVGVAFCAGAHLDESGIR